MLRVAVFGLACGNAAAFTVMNAPRGARTSQRTMVSPIMADFYDFSGTTLSGDEMSMSSLKGKPVLILNVASL